MDTALSSLGLRLAPKLHVVKMIDQETFPEIASSTSGSHKKV